MITANMPVWRAALHCVFFDCPRAALVASEVHLSAEQQAIFGEHTSTTPKSYQMYAEVRWLRLP